MSTVTYSGQQNGIAATIAALVADPAFCTAVANCAAGSGVDTYVAALSTAGSVLTLTQNEGQAAITVDLAAAIASAIANDPAVQAAFVTQDKYTTAATAVGTVVTFTGVNGQPYYSIDLATVVAAGATAPALAFDPLTNMLTIAGGNTVDLGPLALEINVASVTFDPLTGNLVLTETDGTPHTVVITQGSTVTVVETPNTTGQVDITSGTDVGNAVLSIDEQLATTVVDASADYITIWDDSIGGHRKVLLSDLAEAVTSAAYGTPTFSQDKHQNAGNGSMWLLDGDIYSYGYDAGVNGLSGASNGAPVANAIPVMQPAFQYEYGTNTLIGYQPKFTKFWKNRFSAFALDQNGKLWYKGSNFQGQSGIITAPTSDEIEAFTRCTAPLNTLTISDIVLSGGGMAASDQNTSVIAITNTGVMYSWGDNTDSQLGRGSTTDYEQTPAQINLPAGTIITKAIFSSNDGTGGDVAAYALSSTGVLRSWGRNNQGQLAIGSTTDQSLPQIVVTTGTVVDVWADDEDVYVEKADGTLWTAGLTFYGQAGRGVANSQVTTLVQATAYTGGAITDHSVAPNSIIGAGMSHYLIDATGNLWVAGGNSFGQLGLGSGSVSQQNAWQLLAAVQAPFQGRAAKVFANGTNTPAAFVLTTDGELWSAGYNGLGGRGIGEGDTALIRSQWRKSMIPTSIVDVQPSGDNTNPTFFARDVQGDLWVAGHSNGLPNGMTSSTSQPVKVMWTRNVAATPSVATTNVLSVVGSTITSTVNGVAASATLPSAVAFRTAVPSNTAIPSSAQTTLLFTAEDYDTAGALSGGVFTAPAAGIYNFAAAARFAADAAFAIGGVGDFTIYIRNVTTGEIRQSGFACATWNQGGSFWYAHISVDFQLTAGQQVDVQVRQNTGGTRTLNNGATVSWFSGHKVA